MTNKQRKILILVILFTSIGLIFAQIIWIRGVFINKQNELDTKVNEALTNVAKEVWQAETFTPIYDSINIQDLKKDISYGSNVQYVNISRSGAVLDVDSIMKTSNFNDSSMFKLIDKEKVKRYYVESVVERIITPEIPIEQRVTIQQLDTLVLKEFKTLGINNYNFQIAVCDTSGISIMSSDDYDMFFNSKIYKKQIFEDIPFEDKCKYYMYLYFPEETFMILSSIWPLILSAILLIAVILAIFIYTMYVIIKQKKISEIKNDFISNITHELKTPIATISLAAQLLGDENLPQEAKNIPKLSGMIKEQSKHLSFLVEKVLQTSVFERQTIVLNKNNVSLHEIIKEALEIMSLQLYNKNVKLITELRAHDDIISTEKSYFVNVITNLLDNALKYSKESPQIAIGTLNEDNKILCYVADNGIGIKEEDKNRIFEQFYRVHTGDVHDIKGFGLGLNYVKKIVELSDGTITLDSEVNVGTTFYMWFPLTSKNTNT